MKHSFRIGTRGSKLALWQANHVRNLLSASNPELEIEIQIIKTTGDAILNSPLSEIGGKGVFVKEIEEALLSENVDIAVHSMKDVPTVLPAGLIIGAVVERHDPRDAFISNTGQTLAKLSKGSRIGTGSLRRASQLLHHYPSIKIVSIRGNVDTRIRKLKEDGEFDAIVLAVAGLERMGLGEEITEIISTDIMLPAPGQGIVAIECREGDEETANILRAINHTETEIAAISERAFLYRLGGDCNVPVGCNAILSGNTINLSGIISSPEGKLLIKKDASDSIQHAGQLGEQLAEMILEAGGNEILEQLTSS
ncbi:MAG: porphobilinogen deaminase [Thermodesulfobacteriota bacterium]|nr:MAG: porphobilinogen deaminase [Thermodesulfobacteriota bacterium]